MTSNNTSITAQFQLSRKTFTLNVDITLPMRGVTALFGPSGSGKTTLLRCIAGLEKPDVGSLQVGDEIWLNQSVCIPVHKRNIGYVFQENNLFPHLSVEKNLFFALKRTAKNEQDIPFQEAVELLGIETLLTAMPEQLSGGQRQRVAIARALLSSPKLLLMDEPLASIDLQSKASILPYLETLHNNLAIPMIYVTHSPDEVVRIADHLVLLNNGRVQAQGEINDILTRVDLPLAHLEEASAIIDGKIDRHDDEFHLSYLAVDGGQVAVSRITQAIDTPVRIRILARDVSIALSSNHQSSISNILPAKIKAISPSHDPARVLITLLLGDKDILALITKRSLTVLNLQVGMEVYAQVKSVALMR